MREREEDLHKVDDEARGGQSRQGAGQLANKQAKTSHGRAFKNLGVSSLLQTQAELGCRFREPWNVLWLKIPSSEFESSCHSF